MRCDAACVNAHEIACEMKWGSRTAEEEEGIRASEAIDRILSRLSNSEVVVKGKQPW